MEGERGRWRERGEGGGWKNEKKRVSREEMEREEVREENGEGRQMDRKRKQGDENKKE